LNIGTKKRTLNRLRKAARGFPAFSRRIAKRRAPIKPADPGASRRFAAGPGFRFNSSALLFGGLPVFPLYPLRGPKPLRGFGHIRSFASQNSGYGLPAIFEL
jgi:hypothetical protein